MEKHSAVYDHPKSDWLNAFAISPPIRDGSMYNQIKTSGSYWRCVTSEKTSFNSSDMLHVIFFSDMRTFLP